MTVVTIQEAKERIEELAHLAKAGEQVVITEDGVPSLSLAPVTAQPEKPPKRVGGQWKGLFVLGPEFDEPLPDDWLDAFYNGPVFPDDETSPMRAGPGPEKLA